MRGLGIWGLFMVGGLGYNGGGGGMLGLFRGLGLRDV